MKHYGTCFVGCEPSGDSSVNSPGPPAAIIFPVTAGRKADLDIAPVTTSINNKIGTPATHIECVRPFEDKTTKLWKQFQVNKTKLKREPSANAPLCAFHNKNKAF